MTGSSNRAGDPLRQGVDTVTGDPEALSVAEGARGRGHPGVPPEELSEVLAGTSDLCTEVDRRDWGWAWETDNK